MPSHLHSWLTHVGLLTWSSDLLLASLALHLDVLTLNILIINIIRVLVTVLVNLLQLIKVERVRFGSLS